MIAKATDGGHLDALVRLAVPILQAAQPPVAPRRGAPQWYADWQVATMALIAILAGRRSKSSQYRYLSQRQDRVMAMVGLVRWPSRSTYF